jgi:hypothetical protein
MIAAHPGQTADPQPRSGKLVDAASLCPLDHLLERALNGAGVSALAAYANRLFEQILIKHNIRAFHVYILPEL